MKRIIIIALFILMATMIIPTTMLVEDRSYERVTISQVLKNPKAYVGHNLEFVAYVNESVTRGEVKVPGKSIGTHNFRWTYRAAHTENLRYFHLWETPPPTPPVMTTIRVTKNSWEIVPEGQELTPDYPDKAKTVRVPYTRYWGDTFFTHAVIADLSPAPIGAVGYRGKMIVRGRWMDYENEFHPLPGPIHWYHLRLKKAP